MTFAACRHGAHGTKMENVFFIFELVSFCLALFEDPQSDRRCAAGSIENYGKLVICSHQKTSHQVCMFTELGSTHMTRMDPLQQANLGRDMMFNKCFFHRSALCIWPSWREAGFYCCGG